jgi:septal ring factor EnvC (AmiA/AmiB activator)
MRPAVLSLVLALIAAPAGAADAVTVARAALAVLEAAGRALAEAEGAQDRVAALTAVIHAYETGLAALREGLRQAAIQEAALIRGLDAEITRVAGLLGALETLETNPETLFLLHPQGPLGAVRSGMILSTVTPELQALVEDLRQRVEAVRVIRALQQSAFDDLAAGLAGVQEARTELSLAISNRADLPRRFADDDSRIARLLENADTLAAFAEGLAGIEALTAAPAPGPAVLPLPLPVDGRVIRTFREKDAAGISRPGLLIATAPLALVTTPVAATIRYSGPLLDYGNVMILEPDPRTLLVLAGLARVYGAVGQVIPAGTPVGLMGGAAPDSGEFVAASGENGGALRTETLYLELRQGNDPVDPADWFAGTKDDTR